MPHRIGPDPALPSLLSAEQAYAAGLTKDQVRQRVRSGEWARVGRGWYLRSATVKVRDPYEARRAVHLMTAVAAARRLPGTTICGPSAAILHGLPVRSVPDDVHLIAAPGGWTGRRAGLFLHEWSLLPPHVDIAPVRVTTVCRSWVDLARVQGTASAVIAGDQLLRSHRGDRRDLDAIIRDMAAAHRLRFAVRALSLLDGRRESPLESESACYFARTSLPEPEWQIDLHDADGFIGRVDCGWNHTRLVGEADGRLKYLERDDLYREKRREDRIRATGRDVVRWGAIDLRAPHLARRIAQLLGLPTSSVTWGPAW